MDIAQQRQDDCHEVGVDLEADEHNAAVGDHQCGEQSQYGAHAGGPAADLLEPEGDVNDQDQCCKCCCNEALGEELAAGTCVNVVGVQQFQLAVRIQFLDLVGNLCLPFYGQTLVGAEGEGQGVGVALQLSPSCALTAEPTRAVSSFSSLDSSMSPI